MPEQQRLKTQYPGVYFIDGTSADGRLESIYYMLYRKHGKLIEEKAGRQFKYDLTPARAARIRTQRIEGDKLTNFGAQAMLNQNELSIVEELKGRLKEVAGDRLQSVIVYGSRAWGQAGPDSDLDVAVIIQGCTPELETTLQESAYQVMWDHDFNPIIALKVFDADQFMAFQKKGFSFYRKVAQEGIEL